jgi:hypothetical protein
MTTKPLLLGVIFTLALIGCTRSVVPSPLVTSASSPLTSPQAESEISITYQRSGGFVGANDTWAIDSQGKVTHQGSGASAQLPADQLTELVAAIRAANFMDLKDSYLPKDTCCDRYEYTITVTVGGQSKTVRTIDASSAAPRELTQLVETLNRYMPPPAPAAQ